MKFRDIIRLAMPGPARMAPGLIFGILSALCAVALMAVSAFLITKASEMPPILYLNMAVVGVRAFALGKASFRYVDRLFSHDATFRQLATLRVGIYQRLVPLAPDGLRATKRGQLLSRLTADVDAMQDLPLRVVQPLLTSGIVALAAVVASWMLLPAAGITLAVTLVLAFAVGTLVHSAIAARADRALAPAKGELTERLLETISSLDVLLAFGALDAARARAIEADDALTITALKRSHAAGLSAALLALLSGAACIAALLVAVPALEPAGFDGPALAVVVLMPLALFEVIAMVPLALGAWRTAAASADRIADTVPDEIPGELATDAGVDAGATVDAATGVALVVRDLEVSWPESLQPAISGVSFALAAGERLVVEGPSGAGKTSLAHALVRFLDYRGSITINGVEARALPANRTRELIGLCEQSPWLFDDSLRQNLLFAREGSTDDELMSVLERVGLADWCTSRGGLGTQLGESGALVSGGQAQRIALARAILADFPVLILDEPTANVDPERADSLMADLLRASAGRSVIVISHTAVPDDLINARLRLEPATGASGTD